MKLITNADQVFENIERLNAELGKEPEISKHFSFVHAWYISLSDPEKPMFGFSKFIGYEELDAAMYLKQYKNLDGRNTEWALKDFSEELHPESPQFEVYYKKLTEWLAELGKTPRNRVRLMIVTARPEARETGDRRLLDLLTAVADMLPLEQRHELRSLL